MFRKSIGLTWTECQSHRGLMPTAKEMEDLIEDRRQSIHALHKTTPLASFSVTDFWDSVLLDMINHYFSAGVATPHDFGDDDMARRQAEYVIRRRFGTSPHNVLQSLDHIAREIVNYIEQAWDDAMWAD
jgi:hypothetical protein